MILGDKTNLPPLWNCTKERDMLLDSHCEIKYINRIPGQVKIIEPQMWQISYQYWAGLW